MIAKVVLLATPNPWLKNCSVPVTGWPAFTAAGKVAVTPASGAGVTLVAALELEAALVLITVAGAVIEAILTMLLLPAVPLTVKVTELPLGKVAMGIPGP